MLTWGQLCNKRDNSNCTRRKENRQYNKQQKERKLYNYKHIKLNHVNYNREEIRYCFRCFLDIGKDMTQEMHLESYTNEGL